MKVAHIIKGLGRGGAEMLLPETIRVHDPSIHFDLIYFLPWKNQLVPELQSLNVNVTCLKASGALDMLLKLPRLVRLIRANNFDVLHAHLPWAGVVARIAGLICGVKVVYTEHNDPRTYNILTRIANKLTFRLNDATVAVSQSTEAAMISSGIKKVTIKTVINGVNTEKFDRRLFKTSDIISQLGISGKKVVLTVAVFRIQKRLDRWIAIARQVANVYPNVHFIIVGDGPLRPEVEASASDLAATNRITFTGICADPRPYFAAADVYLMSSDFEGLPIAMLEAMSMGCVPVATKVGGIPDVIRQNENGFLYEKSEEERAAAELVRLLNNAGEVVRLSAAARQTVEEKFSVVRMSRELEAIYNSLK